MKREKFLWPLTHGHHHGLTAARNIDGRLAANKNGKDVARLAKEVRVYARDYLSNRFKIEKKVLDLFALHVGLRDIDLVRIFRTQKELKALAAKGTAESLRQFASKLRSYIFYEADWFFDRLEGTLTAGEKLQAFGGLKKFDPAFPELPKAAE